jgi:bla regulator protein BlaR1
MKMFFNLFSEALVSAFGWTLVHSLWQGALLALIASIGFYFLRKSPASLRYNLGIGTLCLQVIASLATFSFYYLNSSEKALATVVRSSTQVVTDWKTLTYEVSLTTKLQLWLTTHIQELVICWLIGAFVLILRFLGGWIYTEHLRHNSRLVMNKEWRARFGVLTAKLKIYQSIELKESAKILTPMVIGTLQPVVLIPIGLLTGFPTSQIEAILAHELAHIRRYDYLVNMLQSFVEVVFFFHPALWWLSERVRIEREHCCDDLAVEVCGDRISLAHALVGIAEWKTNHSLAMAFASKKPLLLQRVKRVMGITPKPARIMGNLPITLVFIAALAGMSMYAVGQDNVKKKKAKTHQVSTKHKVVTKNGETVIAEVEPEVFVSVPDIEENIDINVDIDEPEYQMSDSLKAKMGEFQQKMDALQKEMEPLERRMQELQQEMEKKHFDIEHFERNEEKLDWKKDRASEARQGLIEKRSNLLHPDGRTKTKLSEADLDKQLADFEQQIKAQEQIINQLNAELAANHKEAEKAEQPYNETEKEIEELSRKIDDLGAKIGLTSLSLIPRNYAMARSSVRARRAVSAKRASRVEFAPPPPPPARVTPPAPAAAPRALPKPPVAPVPPIKK